MNNDSKREQIALGLEAAKLLASPIIGLLFASMKADCIKTWENTKIDDVATRDDAWRMHKAIGLFEFKLKNIKQNGELARKDLLKSKKKEGKNK